MDIRQDYCINQEDEMTKTHKIYDWQEWLDLCDEYNEDPQIPDFGVDQGGGDSISFEYEGDIPEEED